VGFELWFKIRGNFFLFFFENHWSFIFSGKLNFFSFFLSLSLKNNYDFGKNLVLLCFIQWALFFTRNLFLDFIELKYNFFSKVIIKHWVFFFLFFSPSFIKEILSNSHIWSIKIKRGKSNENKLKETIFFSTFFWV